MVWVSPGFICRGQKVTGGLDATKAKVTSGVMGQGMACWFTGLRNLDFYFSALLIISEVAFFKDTSWSKMDPDIPGTASKH